MSKKYTDKDLANILAEVEVEFQKHIKPEAKEEKLAKNESAQAATASTETVKAESYDAEDLAEVEKMYSEMEKSEAEIHYKAVKKAMFGEAGEEKINKSEASVDMIAKSEFDAVKAENEELKKSFSRVTEVLTKMFSKKESAPKQKAVTSIEVMKKSEEEKAPVVEGKDVSKLSTQQINSTLSSKIRNGELKKSDKEAVQKYFDTNSKNIELVKHLL
jgi:hypothetical protein